MTALDHLILPVNQIEDSLGFYSGILGLGHEGSSGPFAVLRVNAETTLQLAPWGTEGGQHLAFAFSPEEFAAAFARVKAAGLPYGDSFHDAANGRAPGEEDGAQGRGTALYLLDPNQHLIELRHY
jgi:catechol 2,3-dioxygenase-like lactoylglutathione lyase family enzyme